MTDVDVAKFWLESSKSDRKIASDLFGLKHYHMALFMWQMALEKLLKFRIVNAGKEVIPSHKLNILTKRAGIKVNAAQEEKLDEITAFNIEARYDDYKRKFYKQATRAYTQKWTRICDELYNLIENYDWAT